MSASQGHSHKLATVEETKLKIRGYLKIFALLLVLTVIEIAALGLSHFGVPHFWITVIVVLFSCAKAAAVGYWFMHLNHEKTWLKVVACAPLIGVMYAVVLVLEAPIGQKISVYYPEYPRVKQEVHHEAAAPAEHGEASASPATGEIAPPAEAAPAPESNEWK